MLLGNAWSGFYKGLGCAHIPLEESSGLRLSQESFIVEGQGNGTRSSACQSQLLVLLPLEWIPPWTFLLPFYLVESSGLSFSSRAWALFPLTALSALVAHPSPLGAEPGWVASSTGSFRGPLPIPDTYPELSMETCARSSR